MKGDVTYKITVKRIVSEGLFNNLSGHGIHEDFTSTKIFTQKVNELDIKEIISAVNSVNSEYGHELSNRLASSINVFKEALKTNPDIFKQLQTDIAIKFYDEFTVATKKEAITDKSLAIVSSNAAKMFLSNWIGE